MGKKSGKGNSITLLCGALLIAGGLVFALYPSEYQKNLTDQETQTGKSSANYLSDVKQVVLYIQPPRWDEKEALRCSGMEEVCADEREARLPEYMRANSINSEQYILKLKQDFLEYPEFLQQKNLKTNFAYILTKYFNFGKDIITPNSYDELQHNLAKKNTLIVYIKYSKNKNYASKTTVLQVTFYRPDRAYTNLPITRAILIPSGTESEDALEMIVQNLKAVSILLVPKSH